MTDDVHLDHLVLGPTEFSLLGALAGDEAVIPEPHLDVPGARALLDGLVARGLLARDEAGKLGIAPIAATLISAIVETDTFIDATVSGIPTRALALAEELSVEVRRRADGLLDVRLAARDEALATLRADLALGELRGSAGMPRVVEPSDAIALLDPPPSDAPPLADGFADAVPYVVEVRRRAPAGRELRRVVWADGGERLWRLSADESRTTVAEATTAALWDELMTGASQPA